MPWLTGWGKRKEIRYGTVFPGANLTDFPLLVKIAGDSDIATELGSGGGITVTDDSGDTEIPFGLYPTSDPISGDIVLRIKSDILTGAATGDVIGYIYYDASETTVEDKAGTVSNGYELFMPLEEDPSGTAPQMFDWVTETNVGTLAGGMTSGDLVAAEVEKGLDFDASDDVLTVSDSPAFDPVSLTVECWLYPKSRVGNQYQAIVTKTNNFWDEGWGLVSNPESSGVIEFFINNYTVAGAANVHASRATYLPLNEWAFLSGTYDGSTIRIYAAGLEVATSSYVTGLTPTARDVRCGFLPTLAALDGILDEVRISSVARSADWLEYAYYNDFTPNDTTTLGPEEEESGGSTGEGSGVGNLTLGASGTGKKISYGNGTGNLTLGVNGTGAKVSRGNGTGNLTLGASGEGYAPVVDGSGGSGVGILTLGAVGTGKKISYGSGTGNLTLGASSEGEKISYGSGTGTLVLSAYATGEGANELGRVYCINIADTSLTDIVVVDGIIDIYVNLDC